MKIRNNRKQNMYVAVSAAVVLLGILLVKQPSFASWVEEEEGIRYETEEGQFAKGFSEIKGKRYYFDEDGYLLTGKFYVKDEETYYYADEKGVVQTGMIETKHGFYIADDTGKIQTGFIDYNSRRYYFNKTAELVKGWFKVKNSWYYADETGAVMTGFVTLDGYRYYLGSDGARVSDAVMEIDSVIYIFNKDGSVDENATALYPVYQYFNDIRAEYNLPLIELNSKVQACAVLRASGLTEGFGNTEEEAVSMETLLKNRGVMCSGGFEFSFGGVEGYGIEKLLADIKRDINLNAVLKEAGIAEAGLGVYEKDGICYYDIIFIRSE